MANNNTTNHDIKQTEVQVPVLHHLTRTSRPPFRTGWYRDGSGTMKMVVFKMTRGFHQAWSAIRFVV